MGKAQGLKLLGGLKSYSVFSIPAPAWYTSVKKEDNRWQDGRVVQGSEA